MNPLCFPYRFGKEIKLRRQVQTRFNTSCAKFNSIEAEVPLIETLDSVIGDAAHPLRESHLNRVFHGLTFSDRRSIASAVRYEASGPLAAYAVKNQPSSELRFHYMQEMVRLENSAELSATRHRAFYQLGQECFCSNQEKNISNLADAISLLCYFLTDLGLKPRIRLSHVAIPGYGILSPELDNCRRRLIPLFEQAPIKILDPILTKLALTPKLKHFLLSCLRQRNVPLAQGLNFLHQYPELQQAAEEFQLLITQLNLRKIPNNIIRFDAGIYRSLGFYSGLVLQADTEFIREIAGGGDFSAVMQIYDPLSEIKSCGFAIGYERIAVSLDKSKSGANHDISQ